MNRGLKPYPKYKDSGVPWLGEVPEHWEIQRLKATVQNVVQQTTTLQDDDLHLALEHVESWTGRIVCRDQSVTFDSQVKRFQPNDVLLGKLRPYLAKVARPMKGGVCVGEFLVLRPFNSSMGSPYLEHFLRSSPIVEAISSSTFGAKMPRADWHFVGGMPVTLPSLSEQAAIVQYLDYMDRRIGKYIRVKQKLIALLNEQKQAIIHRAVTGQVDVRTGRPYPSYKPSGVKWLGDVPEHWAVVPLRWYISIGSGDFIQTEKVCAEATQDRPYPVIGGNGIMGYAAESNISETTIVLGRVGALCGNVHLVSGSAWITDNALRMSHIKEFSPEYLATQLQVMNLNRLANANAQPLITGGMIKSQHVVKPSKEEQRTLIALLGGLSKPLDTEIDRATREISLLREYRTRLIADVVTGKLDVREAAASLPNEANEPEELGVAEELQQAAEETGAYEGDEGGLSDGEVPDGE